MLDELKELEEDFSVSGENAGLHVLLTDKRGRTEEQLEHAAAVAEVKVYGLEAFRMEGTTEKGDLATMILGYGGLSPEEITEGIGILKKVWR